MKISRLSVVALCAMVGACSPNIAVDDQEPPLGDIPTITSLDQIALPIDAYLPSIEQSVAMLLVGYDLVNACIMSGGSQSTIQIPQAEGADGEFQPATVSELTHLVATSREEGTPNSALWGFSTPTPLSTMATLSPLVEQVE